MLIRAFSGLIMGSGPRQRELNDPYRPVSGNHHGEFAHNFSALWIIPAPHPPKSRSPKKVYFGLCM
jgi:hypothetical protein